MVKIFMWEARGIVCTESGPCAQVNIFILCVGIYSMHSGKQDVQGESGQLCMLWYSYALYGYVCSSVRMFGVVLRSIMSM
jgi:hypothetical protein